MTAVVVDASVFIAAAMADGRARFVLFHSEHQFLAPADILRETIAAAPKIAHRAGIDEDLVEQWIMDLASRIVVVDRDMYAPMMDRARVLAKKADAEGDEEYIALALTLDAPVWTYDDDFRRVPGIMLVRTSELV